ncbi:MAG TPA: hypothetical protein VGF08_10965 [Terriglobales bacterium]
MERFSRFTFAPDRWHDGAPHYIKKKGKPAMSHARKSRCLNPVPLIIVLWTLCCSSGGQQIPLQALVTPSTIITRNGQPVPFAVHAFIEFQSLSDLFPYIDSQTARWKGRISEAELHTLQQGLLRQGIESRVVSMTDERPLDSVLTHTREELQLALAAVTEPVPSGYAEAFLAVQEKWKHSLNCWSASSSIYGRVLSNWYPIEEGIPLFGATYDSSEHFWQAVKYHPDTTIADLTELLGLFEKKDWKPWFSRLDNDPKLYLPNAYAVEFLRHNLAPGHLLYFREELGRHGLQPREHARAAQQRSAQPAGASFRFTAPEEKALWGDLADVLYLVYLFSPEDDPIRKPLADRHFDFVYLGDRKMGFISKEFRELMFEVFKVKYLQIPRLREVITSIPMQVRIEHYLNGGDSPDIPIPVYVGYLNEIREMARSEK